MKGTPEPATTRREDDHKLAAVRFVLAERERELLELKGPCSNAACCLHYAHAGPCNTKIASGEAG